MDPFGGLPQMIDNIPDEIVAILSLHDIAIKVASLHKIIIGMPETLCEYDSLWFFYFAERDAQCVGYPFAVCRVGLQTVSYMPQFDLPGGITHCTSGVGK